MVSVFNAKNSNLIRGSQCSMIGCPHEAFGASDKLGQTNEFLDDFVMKKTWAKPFSLCSVQPQ